MKWFAAGRWCAAQPERSFCRAPAIGPKYMRPAAPASPAFKEALPNGWTSAQPDDSVPRGPWWNVYKDSGLDAP